MLEVNPWPLVICLSLNLFQLQLLKATNCKGLFSAAVLHAIFCCFFEFFQTQLVLFFGLEERPFLIFYKNSEPQLNLRLLFYTLDIQYDSRFYLQYSYCYCDVYNGIKQDDRILGDCFSMPRSVVF